MEQKKRRYLRTLLDFQERSIAQNPLIRMRELENRVPGCYADAVDDMNSHQLGNMLLFDNCFPIEFIIKFRNTWRATFSFILGVGDFGLCINDMMLLENQPSALLRSPGDLESSRSRRVNNGETLDSYFLFLHKGYWPTNSTTVEYYLPAHSRYPYHLLHLFHRYIIPHFLPGQGYWSLQETIPCVVELRAAGVEFYGHTESYFRNL